MRERTVKRIENILLVCTVLLIPLHLIGGFLNVINGIDKGYGHTYPMECYVLICIYLLIVAGTDVFILLKKDFLFAKSLRRYWLFTVILLVVVFVKLTWVPIDWFALEIFIVSTPYIMLVPLLEEIVNDNTAAYFAIVTAFSLLNYFVCHVPERE